MCLKIIVGCLLGMMMKIEDVKNMINLVSLTFWHIQRERLSVLLLISTKKVFNLNGDNAREGDFETDVYTDENWWICLLIDVFSVLFRIVVIWPHKNKGFEYPTGHNPQSSHKTNNQPEGRPLKLWNKNKISTWED